MKVICLVCALLLSVTGFSQGQIDRSTVKSTSSRMSKKTNKYTTKTTRKNKAEVKSSKQGYVDLGLPSGTLWKDKNEDVFYTYDEAELKFRNELPTFEQCEELVKNCIWQWEQVGYKIVGPNGNYIFLPAAGQEYNEGNISYIGEIGNFWILNTKHDGWYWLFEFTKSYYEIGSNNPSCKRSVRIVKH